MPPSLNRREFLRQSSAAGVAAVGAAPAVLGAGRPGRRVVVGVMGVNSRGRSHIEGYQAQNDVEIRYICDVDVRARERGAAMFIGREGAAPKLVGDFRRMLEDPEVDAVSIAAPNHWHSPAAILACQAGKHVYVEKPGSHNGHEAQLLAEVAARCGRVVQLGTQRRSWPWIREAMERLHAGEIGTVRFARSWYAADRGTIGRGRPGPVPAWLDYALWQGPAPEQPYVDNLVHYNWHWRWHWGGGELANNGVHALDLVRWGLRADHPRRVTCGGGRYHFHDDQQTPDTYMVTYDFGETGAVWESQSCAPRGLEGGGFGAAFYGDGGAMVIGEKAAVFYDRKQKVLREVKGGWDDLGHFANFIDCVRSGAQPNAPIGDGHKSALLCHLGNIAWRTGRSIEVDPASGRPRHDSEAAKLWRREYRRGWEPKA